MNRKNWQGIAKRRGGLYPLGLSRQGEWLQFTSVFEGKKEIKLQFWERGEKTEEILLDDSCRRGNLYSICIPAKGRRKIQYTYEVDGVTVVDPCAKKLYAGRYGGADGQLLAGEANSFDWEEDTAPQIPYQEMLLYRLQVRGFTKHSASEVKHKGTFHGLCEKIPYLKELGVNAVLLMPCYEFEDRMVVSVSDLRFAKYQEKELDNFWGYGGQCWYFVPKAGYCVDKKNPEVEFRRMIKEFHANKIEIIMEFSFKENTSPFLMIECLRYWAEEYHIDGIYFNDNVAPTDLIANDPVLSRLKLVSRYWKQSSLPQEDRIDKLLEKENDQRRLANYNNGFLISARCFLKGDGGQVKEFAESLRKNSEQVAQINYLADNNGFTVADMVSYNDRHNEANGEDNHDGEQENYSWNCGVEGRTKKQFVISLRERQRKNAMLMLFLSQGVPMLYAGDEFGNSQDGNNNVYCQDNKKGWVSWDQLKKQERFLGFVKRLVALRREMAVFHNHRRLTGQDYLACGSPDISWHGERAWYPDFSQNSRLLGVMLNGKYTSEKDSKSLYIVFNMNWKDATVGFPRPEKGQCWKLYIDTAKTDEYVAERMKREERQEYYMKARSVAVFVSADSIEKPNIKRMERRNIKNI